MVVNVKIAYDSKAHGRSAIDTQNAKKNNCMAYDNKLAICVREYSNKLEK